MCAFSKEPNSVWASSQTSLCISSLLEQVPSLRNAVLQEELEFSRTRRAGEARKEGTPGGRALGFKTQFRGVGVDHLPDFA